MSYETPGAGEWVNPKSDGYKLACCDCGLVHKVDFRIIQPTVADSRSIDEWKEVHDPNLTVLFRVFRDNRATGQIRRHMRKP